MLSGFSGIVLVIMPTDNNLLHKVQETEAKKYRHCRCGYSFQLNINQLSRSNLCWWWFIWV